MGKLLKCNYCKKEFITSKIKKKYCSNTCKRKGYKQKQKKALLVWRKKNKQSYNSYMRLYMAQHWKQYTKDKLNLRLGTFYLKKRENDYNELQYIKKLKKKIMFK